MDNQETSNTVDQSGQDVIKFNRPNLLIRIKSMLADSVVIVL